MPSKLTWRLFSIEMKQVSKCHRKHIGQIQQGLGTSSKSTSQRDTDPPS